MPKNDVSEGFTRCFAPVIVATDSSNSFLSTVYHALYAPFLQIYTYLFGVRKASIDEAWSNKRTRIGYLANTKMQPMGWKRVRPGSLNST